MDSTGVLHNTPKELRREPPFLARPQRRLFFDQQPPVPVLPETRLLLLLLTSESAVGLDLIAKAILSDLGATLEVLRLTAADRAASIRDEFRVEDCIIHLGKKALRRHLEGVLSSTQPARREGARKLWHRAQIAADLSSRFAADRNDVNPRDAYLAGLLYEVGRVPAALGWVIEGVNVADAVTVRHALGIEWYLPNFMEGRLDRFSEGPVGDCIIRQIVEKAWAIATSITDAHCEERSSRAIFRTTAYSATNCPSGVEAACFAAGQQASDPKPLVRRMCLR